MKRLFCILMSDKMLKCDCSSHSKLPTAWCVSLRCTIQLSELLFFCLIEMYSVFIWQVQYDAWKCNFSLWEMCDCHWILSREERKKKGKATNMVACCTGGSTKRYKSGERRRAQFYHGADAIAVLAATTRLDALPEIRDSPVSAQINRASVRPDGLFW